mgnify:CR=1 FL=1
MNMKNTKTKYSNQKGQTLLFVIVAVTIAMAVGVSVSTRTISSLKRVARTDTSARVIATAEGGIENLLGRPYDNLDDAMVGGEAGCDAIEADTGPESGTCQYVFNEDISEDLISSRAVVKVEKIIFDDGEEFSFTLDPGSLREVNLDGYSDDEIKICWDSDDSAIYYYSYNQDGEVLKGGIKPNPLHSCMSMFDDRFVDEGGALGTTYPQCQTVKLVDNNRYGLRIKVLYNDSKVAVFPTTGYTLPPQGYKFTSIGEIVTGSGSEEKATVIVHKSYPYAPDIFDYGIYTPETLQ